ncbi:DNA-3-methyladenine glycosylase family protein [Oryzibacter oryziterrae]|uniref:DNA-3-methyladenine glycosylase family protein n=1 Tax=Oryzibacter oryziterrae TaxID=2766474 RepID=UPI001F324676|nr:DNA-3-methyladenine glycosylase 2 family protein [Oryzibacter oryziterrae]
MRLLLCDDDMREGLDWLVTADKRLESVRAVAGTVEIRYRPPGFEGLSRIVVAQMLSVASAAAIWQRYEALLGTGCVTAERFLAMEEADLRACGLSGGKVRTLRAAAEAAQAGLDLEGLAGEAPDVTIARLTALPGVGRWTADIFLLFCARHADIFPAGDLALQIAAQEGLGLETRPSEKEMRRISEAWSPWRGVAAKLFWAYYKAVREGRAALPA